MAGTLEERNVTVFGAVSYETLEKIRQIIYLHKEKRVMLSQKELVGQIVTRFIDQVVHELDTQQKES
jgi:hypothetical protein